MSIIQGNAHTSAGGGYQIERSLRFNSADSANLSRTPASAGNRRTWTWSGWVKRTGTGNGELFNCYIGSGSSNDEYFGLSFSSNRIIGELYSSQMFSSVALYRDHSAWYHIVFALDTTLATADNRARLYVNGIEVGFDTRNNPTQNAQLGINQAAGHAIGRQVGFSNYFNGCITEVNFIDGQALTPSSFGETDTNTGVWKPKAFSGTYGTNGFYLKFADNSGTTSTTLGKDSSGNANNWTPNNFSVTAGAGNDSLVDTPTSYGTDTGSGGEVRGNYATLNPLNQNSTGITLANGNLDANRSSASNGQVWSTMGMTSGKWYAEVTIGDKLEFVPGIANGNMVAANRYLGQDANTWGYYNDGRKINSATYTSYGNSYNDGDTIGIAFDADAGSLYFYKNGTVQNSGTAAFTGLTSGPYFFACSSESSTTASSWNFGQRAFANAAPSGYKALCTQNLPTPTIGATSTTQANDYFNAVLYTGNASVKAVTGVGFQPDFTWVKGRSYAGSNNAVTDAVRGLNKVLLTNLTNSEITGTTYFNSIDSDGFTLNTDSNSYNGNNETYVAWNWKANGAGSSNTAGTITSTVSANTTSGFSIVRWVGTAANATVGHGLGAVPSMLIIKERGVADNWGVYHVSVGNQRLLSLNSTNAQSGTSAAYWNNTTPTSTVFSVGTDNKTNGSNAAGMICYAFAPVAGYSAFGSYTGNGSTDGPFVYTGFRPKWVMVKSSTSIRSWVVSDGVRNPYNVTNLYLLPSASDAEATNDLFDFTSNGFKVRASLAGINESSQTFIYAAFAETPAKFSLAR